LGLASIDTRAALISVAAELFAERGIRGVSLREIGRAAGSRNPGVVQYYFRGRDGLVREVLGTHGHAVAVARQIILERRQRQRDAHWLAAALVLPVAGRLESDGGRAFLQVAAELASRPAADGMVWEADPSLPRWSARVEEALELGDSGTPLDPRRAALRVVHVELARRARVPTARAAPRHIDALVDMVTVLLRGAGD
jgi:AcrR family transcriptional regulator